MRVYVESYGCSQNQGEGTAIAHALQEAGHRLATDPTGADVGILVTCGVIGTTEARMVRRWNELSRTVPHVVVTGCLVPLRTALLTGPGRERTVFVPIREQGTLPDLLARWKKPGEAPPVEAPAAAPAPSATAEVVIAQGCTSRCTYCFSRLARGPLQSVPSLEILRRISTAAQRGAVEVRLTSLDTSAWGHELLIGTGLPDLLDSVAALPGDFQVRVGMMSPATLRPILAEFARALADPKFFAFLHLPVQSGSDAVLARMQRGYTVEEFRECVRTVRAALPELMLSTDVIVGFPGENDADFQATLRLVEEIEPEIVNVTRFSPRPMTPAARWTTVPSKVAKDRSRALTAQRLALARAKFVRWIGRSVSGRVVEHGVEGSSVLRLPNYLPMVLADRRPLGATVPARVTGARSTYLLGEACSPSTLYRAS